MLTNEQRNSLRRTLKAALTRVALDEAVRRGCRRLKVNSAGKIEPAADWESQFVTENQRTIELFERLSDDEVAAEMQRLLDKREKGLVQRATINSQRIAEQQALLADVEALAPTLPHDRYLIGAIEDARQYAKATSERLFPYPNGGLQPREPSNVSLRGITPAAYRDARIAEAERRVAEYSAKVAKAEEFAAQYNALIANKMAIIDAALAAMKSSADDSAPADTTGEA